jgi:hypothetical protein
VNQNPDTMQLENQLLLYIDLLGVGDATNSADDTNASDILAMLSDLAEMQSAFAVESTPRTDGSSSLTLRPAISTFSDHIVISYPIERLPLQGLGGLQFGLVQFCTLATLIAASALRRGLLIRGGMTIGSLVHTERVIFGEALVEAYLIESRTAVYPRIVLSQHLADMFKSHSTPNIYRGFDGLYCLNYLMLMALRSTLPGEGWKHVPLCGFSQSL